LNHLYYSFDVHERKQCIQQKERINAKEHEKHKNYTKPIHCEFYACFLVTIDPCQVLFLRLHIDIIWLEFQQSVPSFCPYSNKAWKADPQR